MYTCIGDQHMRVHIYEHTLWHAAHVCMCVCVCVCALFVLVLLDGGGRFSGSRSATFTWLSDLTFEWGIASDGGIHKEEVCVKAKHAVERGVPFPKSLRGTFAESASRVNVDAARFDAWAWDQTCLTLCPCGYIGARVGDKYERDPLRWKLGTFAAVRQMTVYFEWLHVKVGVEKARHVVGVSVSHVFSGGRLE